MDMLKEVLSANFKVNLFGKLTTLISRNIDIDNNKIKADVRSYAPIFFKEHDYEQAGAVHIPLPKSAELITAKSSENL